LTNVTIGNHVTNIGGRAFCACTSLTNVTIPNSVTSIEREAFGGCAKLKGLYFLGNAPYMDWAVFDGDTNATIYYLPGTTGWEFISGRPTVLWRPPNLLILTTSPSFGLQPYGFRFSITGSSNLLVVVETSSNFADGTWSPIATNTLTYGLSYFSDPQWTNYPSRFYRLRSP
jgi:hypothetical protein